MRQRLVEAFEAVAGKGQPLTMYDWEKLMQELKQRGLILPEDVEIIYKHVPCFPLAVDTFIQTLCIFFTSCFLAQAFRNPMLSKLEETMTGATSNLRSCQGLMSTINMSTLKPAELTNLYNIVKIPFENLFVFLDL